MHAVRSTWMVIACEMSITQMIRKSKFCSVFDCYCSTQIRNPIDLNVDRMRNEHYTNDRKKSVLQCFRLLSFKSNTCYAGCPIDLNVCRMRNEHYTYDKKKRQFCSVFAWCGSNQIRNMQTFLSTWIRMLMHMSRNVLIAFYKMEYWIMCAQSVYIQTSAM